MFKKVPGNQDLKINLKCQISNHGEIVNKKLSFKNIINLNLYGTFKKVTSKWLSLLAWYESGYIHNLKENLSNIIFVDVDNNYLRLRCKKLMFFKEPIYYKKSFRYIPNYPRYAINVKGELIDTFNNTLITRIYKDDKGYISYYIRDPDKNKNRHVKIHRLICLAWLPNDDYVNRCLINHIDGNKLNNSLINLEWCSPKENAQHALKTGLVTTLLKVKLRDVKTGKIYVFESLSEMSNFVGLDYNFQSTLIENAMPGYLLKNRYEIKFLNDDTPWAYENTEFDSSYGKKAIYTIKTFNKLTGETKTFFNTKKFCKEFNIWVPSLKIELMVLKLKSKQPNIEVTYERNSLKGPYTSYDIVEKKYYVDDSIVNIANRINRNRNEIRSDLTKKVNFIYDKRWIVCQGIQKIDIKKFKDKPLPFKKIEITANNGKKIIANSIRDAAKITGFNPKTIKFNLDKNRVTRGFTFRALG